MVKRRKCAASVASADNRGRNSVRPRVMVVVAVVLAVVVLVEVFEVLPEEERRMHKAHRHILICNTH